MVKDRSAGIDLLKAYGYSMEDVYKWLEEERPEYKIFEESPSLLAKLFLRHHGVRIPVAKHIPGEPVKISELRVNKTSTIRVVLILSLLK